jgi:hypothetical protein
MYIGTVEVGHRLGLGVVDEEKGRFSMGVSMGAVVSTENYDMPYTDIVLTFPFMRESVKNTLKGYLNTTVHQGGIVLVTPDGADDMQVGRNTITPFLYMNMRAVRVSTEVFRTEIFLRFIGGRILLPTGYRQKTDPLGRPVLDKAGRPWMVPYYS